MKSTQGTGVGREYDVLHMRYKLNTILTKDAVWHVACGVRHVARQSLSSRQCLEFLYISLYARAEAATTAKAKATATKTITTVISLS